MKILYKTIKLLTIGKYSARIEVKTDGQRLYFSVTQKNNSAVAYTGSLTLQITYNSVSKTLVWNTSGSASVTFDYIDSVKSVTVSGAAIEYKNVSYGTSYTFVWGGSFSDPDPTLTLDLPDAFVFGETAYMSWTVSDPLGREYRVLGVNIVGRSSADSRWINEIQSDYTESSYYYAVGMYSRFSQGEYISVEVMIGCYKSISDDDEHYVGFAEAVTPVYYINSDSLSYTPYYKSIPAIKRGEMCTVSWQDVKNVSPYSVKSYELLCGINGGSIDTVLYSGSGTSYTYTPEDDVKTVRFALRTISNYSSKHSGYNISDWIKVSGGVNVYIGCGGVVKEAGGVFLGIGGEAVSVGEISVG